MINYRDTLITKYLYFYTKFIKKGENAMKKHSDKCNKKNTHNITFPKNKNGRRHEMLKIRMQGMTSDIEWFQKS